jgi:hypothetical protein
MDLSAFSTNTTRRLDHAYYAVLEKMSVLQSTVIAMKQLAAMSQATNETLDRESRELISDIQGQLESMGEFEDHEKRITALQDRIHTSRTKIRTLSDRVDVVRERIEGWETADREWQERTRKRLKVIWIIMSVVFFAMVLLFLSAQYAESVLESTGVNMTNTSISASMKSSSSGTAMERPNGSIPRALTERDECREEDNLLVPSILKERVHEDDRLRLFDEL